MGGIKYMMIDMMIDMMIEQIQTSNNQAVEYMIYRYKQATTKQMNIKYRYNQAITK